MKLAGKVALVTGSAQGIGKAIALRFANEGADIIVHALPDDELAQGTLDEVKAIGRRCCIVRGDISFVEDDYRAIAEGVREMGRIDVLVNNAGIETKALFWDTSEEAYRNVMDVNLKGVFFTIQAFVQYLRESKHGARIINISSVHEELPFPGFTSYCMSKGGMKMMMRNLAIELAPLGVTVNNIAPGAIRTSMNRALLENAQQTAALISNIPLRRIGKPEDVAGVAAFLASSDADYVTGTTMYVDGGLMWNYSEQ
ncbi:SDR family NAD(P)-dependent oxidoreductase [Noviherbaspirillum sp.]|uniref:SDR family NAD(P)-dependent oxidoreductase n=1 Tax=Noviherbaspirillum sp. TaxID=1926288 RepID=UPI002FDFABE4